MTEQLFKECSHYCELISAADQMPRKLEIAIREAVANRSVSVVVLPGDVALQRAFDAPLPEVSSLLPPQPIVTPAGDALGQLAALLNGKARVTLLCGSGSQGAHDQLMALAERLKAPIVHALKGKEHVEWDYELRQDLPERAQPSARDFQYQAADGRARLMHYPSLAREGSEAG
jgi:pyruvate dehydrogenase (quinone)